MTPQEMIINFQSWALDYAVFQEEMGAEGTRHFQGYLEFKNRRRLTAIKRLPGAARMHLEKRRGSRNEARDYSMKDESRESGPYEFGEFADTAQGKRSDLSRACDMLQSGSSLIDVAQSEPTTFVRYNRGLQALVNIQPRERTEAPEVTLLYGPPGCGKTRAVRESESVDELWVSPPGSTMQWFDEYQNQEAALFDDFDGKSSKVPLSTCLQILDRYAIRVPVKGSHVWWLPRRVYITTNYHPREWYDWSSREVQYPALKRRFTHVIYWAFTGEEGEGPLLLTPDSDQWDSFWSQFI